MHASLFLMIFPLLRNFEEIEVVWVCSAIVLWDDFLLHVATAHCWELAATGTGILPEAVNRGIVEAGRG